MKTRNKTLIIIGYGVLCIIALFIIEQLLQIPYVIKTAIKVPLFTVVPWVLNRFFLGTHIGFDFPKETRKLLGISVLLMVVAMLITYVAVYAVVDVDRIMADFDERMKIGKSMMILAGLYTCFVNSLIEEYFFRGFICLGLIQKNKVKLGYVVSALAFALYHISIFFAWFSLPLLLLALLGLVIGGVIFAYFADKTHSLVGSWIIHVVADVVVIGLGLFGWGLFYL